MPPRILLHIGQHKTGSTALQSTLWDDRDRLLEHGILYPTTGHMRPYPDFLAPSHNGLFFGLIGHTGRGTWETPAEMGERLAAEIAANDIHTVLISSERGFMVSDQGSDVLDRLDEVAPGPKDVVAYLRRPDRFLASYHRQLIEMGRQGLAPLHEPDRLAAIEGTFQIDYVGALRPYDERYGPVTLHRYEQVGDTVTHFYRTVLGVEEPDERPNRTNPSIPMVLSDLALHHVMSVGPLDRLQIQALVAHREREKVDLLGPENRRRLLEWFEPQDVELGARVGRERFFDDLAAMVEIPDSWLTVAEANERYREIFEVLIAPVDVRLLRRECMILESRGNMTAASRLFAARAPLLTSQDRDWFRDDLEAATRGDWTIHDGEYAGPPEAPPPPASLPSVPRRALRKARHLAGRLRTRSDG